MLRVAMRLSDASSDNRRTLAQTNTILSFHDPLPRDQRTRLYTIAAYNQAGFPSRAWPSLCYIGFKDPESSRALERRSGAARGTPTEHGNTAAGAERKAEQPTPSKHTCR